MKINELEHYHISKVVNIQRTALLLLHTRKYDLKKIILPNYNYFTKL